MGCRIYCSDLMELKPKIILLLNCVTKTSICILIITVYTASFEYCKDKLDSQTDNLDAENCYAL